MPDEHDQGCHGSQTQYGHRADESFLVLASLSIPALILRQDARELGQGGLQVQLFVDAKSDQPHEQYAPDQQFIGPEDDTLLSMAAEDPIRHPGGPSVEHDRYPAANGRVSQSRRPLSNPSLAHACARIVLLHIKANPCGSLANAQLPGQPHQDRRVVCYAKVR